MINIKMNVFKFRIKLLTVLALAGLFFVTPLPAYANNTAQHQALKKIGEAYLNDKDINAAIEKYSQLQQLHPKYSPVIYNLGRLAEIQEQWKDAHAWYSKYLLLAPNEPRPNFVQSKMEALQELAINDKNPDLKRQRIYDEALTLAQLQFEQKNYNSAIISIDEAITLDSTRLEGYMLGALILMEDNACDEAINYFNNAIKVAITPKDKALMNDALNECQSQISAEKDLNKAHQQSEENDYASAAQSFKKAWLAQPDNHDIAMMAAINYLMAKDYSNSKTILKKLVKTNVPSIVIEANEKLRYIKHLDVKSAPSNIAKQSTKQLAKLPGGSSYLKGLSQARQGKRSSAISHYNQAIEQLPLKAEYAQYYVERAKVLNRQKKTDLALNDLEMAGILNPKLVAVYQLSGDILYQQKKYHEAYTKYSQGIDSASKKDKAQLYFDMGRSRYQTSDYENAITDLTNSLKEVSSKSDRGKALHWRGAAYRNIDRESEAIRDLSKSLALRHNSSAKKDLKELKDNWLVVMSKGLSYSGQTYIKSSTFPDEFIREKWADDKRVTHLAHGYDGWIAVASKNTGYGAQLYKTQKNFPSDFIKEKWKKNFSITNVAHDGSQWTVMMSKDSGLGQQRWFNRVKFPAKRIATGWDEDYRIQNIEYGAGLWSVVLAKKTGIGGQTYKLSTSFPKEFITKKRTEDYHISHVTYGNGEWFVVMSKRSKVKNQSYRRNYKFDKPFIKEYWDSSYDIDVVVPISQDIKK